MGHGAVLAVASGRCAIMAGPDVQPPSTVISAPVMYEAASEMKARRDRLFEQMEQLTRTAQQEGRLRQGLNPIDIWLGVIKLSRPLPVIGGELNELIIDRQLELFLGSLHATALDASEPLRRQPLTLDELDRHLKTAQ